MKLVAPSVDYRANQGSASRSPWINSNGWRFVRQPQALFVYDVKGVQAPLAAAEAFSYGVNALIRSDAAGLKPLGDMLQFLRDVPADDMPPVADIGFQDDGSFASGEVMNLMTKANLLYRVVKAPDRNLKLNAKLGTNEYPLEKAKNPGFVAQLIRSNLTDDKRSLRVYGSLVVLARVTGTGDRLRVQLINFAGAERRVDGLRVRVLGKFAKAKLRAAGSPAEELLDYTVEPDATEFTLPELKSYAVIDLSR
ncbi:MAG TPA: hypothetical protein VLJ39_05825 [Tepidisphaeraceae bacterium]|nr:hypothetical protein [Tepidisphaeraceae bacterium]